MSSPRCWEAPHELVQIAVRAALANTWSSRPTDDTQLAPRVHFGGIASGDIVLNDRASAVTRRLRRSFNDAVAIEMESTGMAYAGHLNRGLPP